jgi:murein DD-endopeptidase MepM/ murein hydrolase activator NlpD
MFIPEGNAKSFSLQIHKNILIFFVIIFLMFIFGFIFLTVKSGEIAAKLQLVYFLQNENKKLKEENMKVKIIGNKLDNIENYIKFIKKISDKESGYSYEENILKKEDKIKELIQDTTKIQNFALEKGEQNKNLINNIKQDSVKNLFEIIPNIHPVFDVWITKRFNQTSNDTEQIHNGVDYAGTLGAPIRATADGYVREIKNDKYYGQLLTLDHGNGVLTRYGHCSQIIVKEGMQIRKGQIVAFIGNTGNSSAPHLHYEILKNGKYIDPQKYIRK